MTTRQGGRFTKKRKNASFDSRLWPVTRPWPSPNASSKTDFAKSTATVLMFMSGLLSLMDGEGVL